MYESSVARTDPSVKDGGQSIGIEASSNGDLRAAIRRQRTRVENADRRAEDPAKLQSRD